MYSKNNNNYNKSKTHLVFKEKVKRLLYMYPSGSFGRNFLSACSGAGDAFGDFMAHQMVTIGDKPPTFKEMEEFSISAHKVAIPDEIRMLEGIASGGKLNTGLLTPKLIELGTLMYRLSALDRWFEYKMHPRSYSGYIDSLNAYTDKELFRFGFK